MLHRPVPLLVLRPVQLDATLKLGNFVPGHKLSFTDSSIERAGLPVAVVEKNCTVRNPIVN
jgi:hypothetical protein